MYVYDFLFYFIYFFWLGLYRRCFLVAVCHLAGYPFVVNVCDLYISLRSLLFLSMLIWHPSKSHSSQKKGELNNSLLSVHKFPSSEH